MITDIFSENIILENERILLRPIEESDHNYLLPFSLNEPDIWKYGLLTAAGEDNLLNYLHMAVNNRNEKKEYTFIVFDKKENAYAGSTRFYDIQQSYLTTQLGYTWYGKDFQRTGLNRHCKLLILSFAFEEWGMERVEFRAHAKNFKSIEAMMGIGCVMEGTLRNHMPTVTRERRDSVVLSILKNEWLNGTKERLLAKIR